MRNRRNWIELVVSVVSFGALSALVWVTDAPRELVPAIWIGGVLGMAGNGYWRSPKCHPRLRRGART
jgi:hypothetical protein